MSSLFQSIPLGWQRTTLRHLAQGPKNGAWGSEVGEDEVDAVCVRVADFDWPRLALNLNDPTIRSFKKPQFTNLQLRPGDIVIEKSGGGEKTPVGRVVSFDEDAEAVTSNFVARIRPHESVCNRFFLYLLAAHYMSGYSHQFIKQNTGIQNLDDTNLFRSDVWVPDLATQRQIADFLDRETARIDLLIEKKQRLVALLGERQDTLVEARLNEIDASHVQRLKFAIRRIEQGWSPQCEDARVEGDNWGVLKLGAITTGVYAEEQHKALPEAIEPIPALRVRVGDVLVARASGSPKLVGKAAFVEAATLNLMLSDKHFRLVPNLKKVRPEYLAVVVNSGNARSQIEDRLSSAEGMARNIGQNVIAGLRCPFPSLELQDEILSVVRSSREETYAIASKTTISIDRLKEYRSALITAAVTGQIDVQTYARSGTNDRRLDAIQEEMGA